jgi:hypothetical protein
MTAGCSLVIDIVFVLGFYDHPMSSCVTRRIKVETSDQCGNQGSKRKLRRNVQVLEYSVLIIVHSIIVLAHFDITAFVLVELGQ